MTYNEILTEVSSETGLSKNLIDKTYKAYWRAIREHITSLPLKNNLTDEEFGKIQPNINIPSLGKLNVTLENYQKSNYTYKKQLERDVTHKED